MKFYEGQTVFDSALRPELRGDVVAIKVGGADPFDTSYVEVLWEDGNALLYRLDGSIMKGVRPTLKAQPYKVDMGEQLFVPERGMNVLVRKSYKDPWIARVFYKMSGNNFFPYKTCGETGEDWFLCIPYDPKLWGTTDVK